MKREIIKTADGLKTIYLPEWAESYHSIHGAYREAKHVFIKSGWEQIALQKVTILEIGFGTGLNAILTLKAAQKEKKKVFYDSLEAFPVPKEEIKELEYDQFKEIQPLQKEYQKLHAVKWEKEEKINENFVLHKIQKKMKDFIPPKNHYNLIYFDAFAPNIQPEMWKNQVLQKMYDALQKGGVFVTYSAKGEVRRNLERIGWKVERIPGPPGKREMLRGKKV